MEPLVNNCLAGGSAIAMPVVVFYGAPKSARLDPVSVYEVLAFAGRACKTSGIPANS
jgi:hypothetical protein